jgi:hypothetical protein
MVLHTCNGSYSYVNLPHQLNKSVSESGAAENHLVSRPYTSWWA